MKRTSLPLQRREFITLLGGAAAAWPLAARAQQPAMPVIGFLSSVTATRIGAVHSGVPPRPERTWLRRWARTSRSSIAGPKVEYDRLPAMAADLIRLAVAVIAAFGDPCRSGSKGGDRDDSRSSSLSAAIRSRSASSPVSRRPGGNVTGVTFLGRRAWAEAAGAAA